MGGIGFGIWSGLVLRPPEAERFFRLWARLVVFVVGHWRKYGCPMDRLVMRSEKWQVEEEKMELHAERSGLDVARTGLEGKRRLLKGARERL